MINPYFHSRKWRGISAGSEPFSIQSKCISTSHLHNSLLIFSFESVEMNSLFVSQAVATIDKHEQN